MSKWLCGNQLPAEVKPGSILGKMGIMSPKEKTMLAELQVREKF